jgi:chemotaxis protein MotB
MSRMRLKLSVSFRPVIPVLMLGMLLGTSGCCHQRRHRDDLTQAQRHARELYAENQRLMAGYDEASRMMMGLDQERNALMSQLADTQGQLATANDRVSNLMAERNDLSGRLAQGLTDGLADGSGVSSALQADGFEFDPVTGLNKFRSDILFDLGSDAIRPEAEPIIAGFASTAVNGAARGLRILVVGHTDDQNIVRPETAIKHPTNWHLSTDRSDAVILQLLNAGVEPDRIASMGYSEFHPLELSKSDTSRQRNRRVELFVVPNHPDVAKWDPVGSVRN